MEPGVEFIASAMTPGSEQARLYTLLAGLGYPVMVKNKSGYQNQFRISWTKAYAKASGESGVMLEDGSGQKKFISYKTLCNEKGVVELLDILGECNLPVPPKPRLSITFDLEQDCAECSKELARHLNDLTAEGIKATVFLTETGLNSALKNGLIEQLTRHETGNHTSDHLDASERNVFRGHVAVGEILRTPQVFRAPRLKLAPRVWRTLASLGYKADSSFMGLWAHPVYGPGAVAEEMICEAPLLDGGDYAHLVMKKMSQESYLALMEKKIREAARFGASCALLFHPQYSGPQVWEKAVDSARKAGFAIMPVGKLAEDTLKGTALQ
ncbi:MAG: hypothetical protein HY751_01125 [Nitrospinae bacterium]|nr:hypothetical protein [Nitrospinota bacterium]